MVDIGKMMLEQLDDMGTGLLAMVAGLQHRPDLIEAEPGRLGITDEPEPVGSLLSVVPVALGRAVRLGQETYLLVVADRLGPHAGLAAEFSNFHIVIIGT